MTICHSLPNSMNIDHIRGFALLYLHTKQPFLA